MQPPTQDALGHPIAVSSTPHSRSSGRRATPLRRARDFTTVMRGSKPCRSRLFVLRMRRNELGGARYGFAISRRVGNAVVRNRIRRRLRPLLREIELPDGYDIVITPQPECASVGIAELGGEIARCVAESATRIGRTP